jgi:antitoxin (DNA-binding transcriptional repressor) of toxin-antitoxin stability system
MESSQKYSYNRKMEINTGDAKNNLSRLIRKVEAGETIVITRHGKPVAQMTAPPVKRQRARLGGMKDRIRLLPGWDAPVDPDRFLEGDM